MFMLRASRPEKYRENPKSSPVAPKPEPLDMDLVAQILETLPFESPRRMFQPIEAENRPALSHGHEAYNCPERPVVVEMTTTGA